MRPYSKAKFWAPEEMPLKFFKVLPAPVLAAGTYCCCVAGQCFFGACTVGSSSCYGNVASKDGRKVGFNQCATADRRGSIDGGSYSPAELSNCHQGNKGTMCSSCDSGYFKGLPWEGQVSTNAAASYSSMKVWCAEMPQLSSLVIWNYFLYGDAHLLGVCILPWNQIFNWQQDRAFFVCVASVFSDHGPHWRSLFLHTAPLVLIRSFSI